MDTPRHRATSDPSDKMLFSPARGARPLPLADLSILIDGKLSTNLTTEPLQHLELLDPCYKKIQDWQHPLNEEQLAFMGKLITYVEEIEKTKLQPGQNLNTLQLQLQCIKTKHTTINKRKKNTYANRWWQLIMSATGAVTLAAIALSAIGALHFFDIHMIEATFPKCHFSDATATAILIISILLPAIVGGIAGLLLADPIPTPPCLSAVPANKQAVTSTAVQKPPQTPAPGAPSVRNLNVATGPAAH